MARDFILFGQPDVTIVVVDATRLERNLNLALQVLEITDRAVICLNLMDEARRHDVQVDERRLARDLGVPVVPTAARQEEGLPELLQAVHDVATGATICKPYRIKSESPEIDESVWANWCRTDRSSFPRLAQCTLGGPAPSWMAIAVSPKRCAAAIWATLKRTTVLEAEERGARSWLGDEPHDQRRGH